MKILKSWDKKERWSAYDTDTFYYVEVEHDGENYILSSLDPWELDEIEKEVLKQKLIRLANREKKIDDAVKAINTYDSSEKSAQDVLTLIYGMKDIFNK